MQYVSDNMNITWICKLCGAVNPASRNTCGECSTAYTSASRQPLNQAVLNQGVIFNNAVINPEPDWKEVSRSLDEFYGDELKEKEESPAQNKKHRDSFGMRLFTWTATLLMWVAILACGSIFFFFVYVVIKAFP
jgi:hypothetical protein